MPYTAVSPMIAKIAGRQRERVDAPPELEEAMTIESRDSLIDEIVSHAVPMSKRLLSH
jgi:hypothetical protein